MSTTRRIVTAVVVFAVAAGLLAVADAKKPQKVALLDPPAATRTNEANPAPPAPKKEKPRAKKYLPVSSFGDY